MTETQENITTLNNKVSDTLYLPLLGRIYASKHFPDYFYDAGALALESHIPRSIAEAEKLSEKQQYYHLSGATRYVLIDETVKHFIAHHPSANIVNLGAGLDTLAQRIGDCSAHFYQLDLPEVITLREQLLPAIPNETTLSTSFLDITWADKIDAHQPTLLVASGLFYYFEKAKVQQFLCDIFARLDKAAIVFDATSRIGLKISNYMVRRTGNKGAPMFFYVNNSQAFFKETLPNINNVKETLFFTQARKQLAGQITFNTHLKMWLCDVVMRGGKIITGGTYP